MPTLGERIKIAPPSVFLFLGAAFAGVIYFAQSGGPDLSKLVSDSQAKLAQSQQKLKETEEATQNKAKFQEEMERVSQTFRMALDYLPKELDIQDLLKKIYSEARASGVELTNFHPKDSASKDFYDEVPMEIEITGNYSQMVLFLANIGKLPRIINIKDVQIGSPTMVDGYPVLKMRGTLIGYRYKESIK